MNADVSRALARFTSELGLSRQATRELAAQFADVNDVDDLPDWIVEEDEVSRAAEPEAADWDDVVRAAGHDTTLGNDELHHWWVFGEGRARWRTWTELRDQLLEHVSPEKAATFASAWFHERYGYYAGSDLNRVKHGKPPRGDKVGPG